MATITDERLEHLRTHQAYGGQHSDLGQTIRDLVDEIRAHRRQIADLLGDD